MPSSPTRALPKLPGVVPERLAKLAKVPRNEQQDFCRRISDLVATLRKRDRRVTSSKPSQALKRAAKAARDLQNNFEYMGKEDRDWLENILRSQMQFEDGKINHLDLTITNLAILFSEAIGGPPPFPRIVRIMFPKRIPPNVRDQFLRVLVFGLLSAARDSRGHFTFDKNPGSGTLAQALNLIRRYLPEGLVPDPLPFSTIQRLKTDFYFFN
jgi:hypothetical protein